MKAIYQKRRANLVTWMAQNGIGMVIISDDEAHRDSALRYFTGLPNDGLLGICVDGSCALLAWDTILAKKMAHADFVLPYTSANREPAKGALELVTKLNLAPNARIEIPSSTPYPVFLQYVDALKRFDVLCRANGLDSFVQNLRAKKDAEELKNIRKACAITDSIIDKIEDLLKQSAQNGTSLKELDLALFIEREAREAGCEGTSFATLAAGAERSFCIHAFPPYSAKQFASDGLSILDFGVMYNGYASDVTLTVAKGELTPLQEEMIALVQEAYNSAQKFYAPHKSVASAHKAVVDLFASKKHAMPHSLGHGLGLEVHEEPRVSTSQKSDVTFEENMVITLEPGLYHEKAGGVRLENDVLITKDGCEILTHSRIIRLP